MAEIRAVARKWGDSIAVILPRSVVKAENICVNDSLHVSARKEYDLSRFFGRLKMLKTAQEMKDEERAGWD